MSIATRSVLTAGVTMLTASAVVRPLVQQEPPPLRTVLLN